MKLDYDKLGGLVPAIVQDQGTGQVLMMAFMNPEAFQETLGSGLAVFYSRSRKRLWRKGEQSGHRLLVREIKVDCDADAVLLRVEAQGGGTCHEGYRSCFFRRLDPDGRPEVVEPPTFDPAAVYGAAEEEDR